MQRMQRRDSGREMCATILLGVAAACFGASVSGGPWLLVASGVLSAVALVVLP